ncbi:MAG: three-Cys-motif partner protein TcmP [Chloroflexota bacterium]|nr:three-Cys-motif partner protein TcmP [Chloroflexota bacterium]
MAESASNRFGGDWTEEKLQILADYLDFYTTALKNQPFSLMYIDAFAGSGSISLGQQDGDIEAFIEGSAQRAISVEDKPFDRLVFVEKNEGRYRQLEHLRTRYPSKDVRTINSDANSFLEGLSEDWQRWRGVLFLDPFATEVKWATIEKIARFNALDIWLLFPVSAIARMLPRSRRPEDISEIWASRLTEIFGDSSWQGLYSPSIQMSLFGEEVSERDPGVDGIIELFKARLSDLFGDRFLEHSVTLRNSRNSPMFEFIFCVGSSSPRAIRLAKGVASHLMQLSE